MNPLQDYSTPPKEHAQEAVRIGKLLGLRSRTPLTEVALAKKIGGGLRPSAIDTLAAFLGKSVVTGQLIPEATFRRAKKDGKNLPREMSERLYEISRVVDATARLFHGDEDATRQFLTTPHPLLEGESPLSLAGTSSAGADAVLKLLWRAEAGFAL